MNSHRNDRRWQFSLRTFLFTVLIVGPVASVIVPIVVEAVTQWKPPPRESTPSAGVRRHTPAPAADNYYETGETPLY